MTSFSALRYLALLRGAHEFVPACDGTSSSLCLLANARLTFVVVVVECLHDKMGCKESFLKELPCIYICVLFSQLDVYLLSVISQVLVFVVIVVVVVRVVFALLMPIHWYCAFCFAADVK